MIPRTVIQCKVGCAANGQTDMHDRWQGWGIDGTGRVLDHMAGVGLEACSDGDGPVTRLGYLTGK